MLGMILVNIFQPGIEMNLSVPPSDAASPVAQDGLSLKEFLHHVFPASVIEAMARNESLQIVVFSLVIGVASGFIVEPGPTLIKAVEAIAHVISKITSYVMNLAPLAVFGEMTGSIA